MNSIAEQYTNRLKHLKHITLITSPNPAQNTCHKFEEIDYICNQIIKSYTK